ncbi:MAG: hypothetical protein CMO30_26765 [Tistrella sp.]|uniref:Uncharacterized protein n=1 Tax=Tistrella mobilis TaxID=171437 RepID=A0A3B9II13_9PROT|nr:hypothetical protein [Tistrella sp.]MAD40647.1 hypothetical protein [Tistrella sp.]MBA78878.1 hypothetical protein [Tistrella sp.]HAE47504.1 hypothetical protein [Tistrella mobilis]
MSADQGDDQILAAAAARYRLEAFLSVDMVGSSAFKFSTAIAGGTEERDETGSEGWSQAIRKFYATFHQTFLKKTRIRFGAENRVRLWKALGDELVYRFTVTDLADTAGIVNDFILALHQTRQVVREISRSLDLKACGWVADFPARNMMIDLDGLRETDQFLDEMAEGAGEGIQDFIGPSMDTGFRLGRFATRRKMVLSVELAALLAESDAQQRLPFCFGYDGREALKGILGGEAYPLIWIDTEDDPGRKIADRREAAMLQMRSEVQAAAVAEFCLGYIDASDWMERPFLRGGSGAFDTVPTSHIDQARRGRALQAREDRLYAEAAPLAAAAQSDLSVTSVDLIGDMPAPAGRGDRPREDGA